MNVTRGNMAYQEILDSEIIAGAAIDNALLVKMKGNFEANNAAGLIVPGDILQVQTATGTNQINFTSNGIFQEVDSGYRVTITPRQANSKILVSFDFSVNIHNGLTGIRHFRLKEVLSDLSFGVGTGSGSRHLVTAAIRGPNYDSNDMCPIHLEGLYSNSDLSSKEFGFQFRSEGSYYTGFNYSVNDSGLFGWTGVVAMKAMEIAQ